jgi:hypothetical protein
MSGLIVLGALATLAHAALSGVYGIFRDELYYLACADHLAWGYVDHPVLSVAVLALVRAIFGESLFVLRLVPALLHGVAVVLTGLLAKELGAEKRGMALAGVLTLAAPELLSLFSFWSMNAFDVVFWAAAALVLAKLLARESPRLWMLLGVVLGLGLENKISVLWFGAGLAVALVATPLRKSLATPWPWACAAIALLLFAPYAVWNVTHGLATKEFMENAAKGKMAGIAPLTFLVEEVKTMHPLSLPLWLGGLVWLLVGREARRFRALAIVWLTVLVILLANRTSRVSYLAASYPIVFAAGGAAAERLFERWRKTWLAPAYAAVLLVTAALISPLAMPVLPVERFLAFQRAMGEQPSTEEKKEVGPLPQFYADRFGWPEMVAAIASAARMLTPEERAGAVVYVHNYGEAGAVRRFGPALGAPPAYTGHNNFWFWGPPPESARVVLIPQKERGDLDQRFASVTEAGRFHHPYVMPYENDLTVFVCRGPRFSFARLWPDLKHFD